jgi:hypothetical protein
MHARSFTASLWAMGLIYGLPAMADVYVGDSRETVQAALGEPRAYIRYHTTELLTFERGQVELKEGRVVRVDLLSAEEAEMLRRQREEEEARRQRAEAELRMQRRVEGERLKAAYLADPGFLLQPASERVNRWQAFRARYPEASLPEDYTVALGEYTAELARRAESAERERRLADLEARVRDAEDRARRAEDDARVARTRSSYVGYYPATYAVGYASPYYYSGSYRSAGYPVSAVRYPPVSTRTYGYGYASPVVCAPAAPVCPPVRTPCVTPAVYRRSSVAYSSRSGTGYVRVRY